MYKRPHLRNMAFLVGQHGFDLLCLAILTFVLARTFNRATAFIALAIAGLSLDGMAVTSSVYPEWLQADLLMLSLIFACVAWRSDSFVRKSVWYSLSFTTFTWSYLTKFNALAFLPLLVLPIILERRNLRTRTQLLAIALACGFINYALFAAFYHRPRTGTISLSYDHSWVLMSRLELIYGEKALPQPYGINTKRWLALSAALPPSYELAAPQPWFENVNNVNELRLPYQGITSQLMTANETELDSFLTAHPLPEKFKLGVSSIPISLYVGLKESDELGTKVFLENVRNHPWPFVKDVAKGTLNALAQRPASHLFPLPDDTVAYQQTIVPLDATHFQLVFGATSSRPYGYDIIKHDDPVIWQPGYKLFGVLYKAGIPNTVLLPVVAVGFFGVLLLGYARGWQFEYFTLIALIINLFGFVIFSSIVSQFRWKEARLALPVVAIILGITCGYVMPQLARMLARRP